MRIGVAFDDAFCFYYPENLELLEDAGAEIVTFSPLEDAALPRDLGLMYLGGGISEAYVPRLAGNQPFLEFVPARARPRRSRLRGGLRAPVLRPLAADQRRRHPPDGRPDPHRHRARGRYPAQRISRPQHRDAVDARSRRARVFAGTSSISAACCRAATASTPRTRCTTATASPWAARAGPIHSCSRRSSTCTSARSRSSPAASSPPRASRSSAEGTRRWQGAAVDLAAPV